MTVSTRRRTLKVLGATGLSALGVSTLSGPAVADESTTGVSIEFLGDFCRYSRANDINNHGQIVGGSRIRSGFHRNHAFL